MGRRPLPKRISPLVIKLLISRTVWGISNPFGLLSPSSGQVTNALLTRSPLRDNIAIISPFDLHVLGTPPAFILSQDQTLRKKIFLFSEIKFTDFRIERLVVFPITIQLSRCLFQLRGLDSTCLTAPCQGLRQTKNRCFFNIGSLPDETSLRPLFRPQFRPVQLSPICFR